MPKHDCVGSRLLRWLPPPVEVGSPRKARLPEAEMVVLRANQKISRGAFAILRALRVCASQLRCWDLPKARLALPHPPPPPQGKFDSCHVEGRDMFGAQQSLEDGGACLRRRVLRLFVVCFVTFNSWVLTTHRSCPATHFRDCKRAKGQSAE